MKHLLDENQTNGCDQTTSEPSIGEDLSWVLLGLNAATTRNVISSTMEYHAPMDHGLFFQTSF
jgi:hypothetical protein